jgi:hypothetical protein
LAVGMCAALAVPFVAVVAVVTLVPALHADSGRTVDEGVSLREEGPPAAAAAARGSRRSGTVVEAALRRRDWRGSCFSLGSGVPPLEPAWYGCDLLVTRSRAKA